LTADSEPGNNNEDGTNPTIAMERGGRGGREPLTTKKKILMTLQQSIISIKEETKKPLPKH
jgi:hypothetical protein